MILVNWDNTASVTFGADMGHSSMRQCLQLPNSTYSCSNINKLLKGQGSGRQGSAPTDATSERPQPKDLSSVVTRTAVVSNPPSPNACDGPPQKVIMSKATVVTLFDVLATLVCAAMTALSHRWFVSGTMLVLLPMFDLGHWVVSLCVLSLLTASLELLGGMLFDMPVCVLMPIWLTWPFLPSFMPLLAWSITRNGGCLKVVVCSVRCPADVAHLPLAVPRTYLLVEDGEISSHSTDDARWLLSNMKLLCSIISFWPNIIDDAGVLLMKLLRCCEIVDPSRVPLLRCGHPSGCGSEIYG
ncbi:hypothetical protein Nepgr_015921 [Nepenthes gracilis]|uniref:Transmembrane protein n=1 Tax=Nepenthes gracilis TaxID=150966 RepID=A0AAD3SNQ2_NEPGR|nr:hypothetical protein Nepgr_015921 [Nepenthes gracilis]